MKIYLIEEHSVFACETNYLMITKAFKNKDDAEKYVNNCKINHKSDYFEDGYFVKIIEMELQ